MEYTLKRKEANTLKINIGDEHIILPLQGSLRIQEVKSMDTPEGTYAFLKKNIPAEILDNLTVDEYNEIISVWKEESVKHSGKSLGES